MFGKLLGAAMDVVISPICNGLDFLDGLTEGEIREKALLRFGADAISGLSIADVIRKLADN
jgi:hypothetical protein